MGKRKIGKHDDEPDFHTPQERSLWRFFRQALSDLIDSGEIQLDGGVLCRIQDLGQVDLTITYKRLRIAFECKNWKGDVPPPGLADQISNWANRLEKANRRQKIPTHGVIYTDKPLSQAAKDACINHALRAWTRDQRKTIGKRFLEVVPPKELKARGFETSKLNEIGWLDFAQDVFGFSAEWSTTPLDVDALVTRRFGRRLFTFLLDADTLLRLAHVPRITDMTATDRFPYQRFVDGKRILEIAEHMVEEELEVNFPNNIICSLKFDPPPGSTGRLKLKIPDSFGTLFIIDGQHRLIGSALLDQASRKKFKYVVTAFENLELHEEARLFAAINRKQKGVDNDLVDYILSRLPDNNADTIAPRVILTLADEATGVFNVRAKDGFTPGGTLRLHQLVSALRERAFVSEKGGSLQRGPTDEVQPTEFLTSYFRAIKEVCSREWRKGRGGFLQSSIGVLVMLEVLSAMVYHFGQRQRSDTRKFERFVQTRVRRLRRFSFPIRWRKETRREVRADNVRAILKKLAIGKDYFEERPGSR